MPQGTKVKGTCIFIHGCKHDPMSWFYKSDKCQDCTGGLGGLRMGCGQGGRLATRLPLPRLCPSASCTPLSDAHLLRCCSPPTASLSSVLLPTQPTAGLPEEVSHTKQCLARGYAVMALMSKDRAYRARCFSSSPDPSLSEQCR